MALAVNQTHMPSNSARDRRASTRQRRAPASSSTKEAPGHEPHVRRPVGQATHAPGKPSRTPADERAHRSSLFHHRPFNLSPYALEHLELVPIPTDGVFRTSIPKASSDGGIVSGQPQPGPRSSENPDGRSKEGLLHVGFPGDRQVGSFGPVPRYGGISVHRLSGQVPGQGSGRRLLPRPPGGALPPSPKGER